jgi:uncharacterized protein with PIN domain
MILVIVNVKMDHLGVLADKLSMAKKSKEKHPAEHYKSIIRKQKKIINELRKEAGRGKKIKDHYEDLEQELTEHLMDIEQENTFIANEDSCPECLKGNLEKIPLGPRKMIKCDSCNYSKVIK